MELINKCLTIAIPTYNRRNYLETCLKILCKQLSDDIEIIVRDNNSTDYDFKEFIEPYVCQYGIKAYQNNINIGADANIARLFEECNTKWLCILGDDDYFLPNALSQIIIVLRNHPNDIFIKFNSCYIGTTIGINGFAIAMEDRNAFNASFFISEGFHNIELTKQDMFNHYCRLSYRFPQILRVMDHLISKPSDTCYFTDLKILETHGADISWNHSELIIPYLTMFDIYRGQRKLFKKNINRCISGTLLYYIDDSTFSIADKIYFGKLLFVKYGIINVLRYNYRTFVYLFAKHIFKIELRNE